MAKVPRTKGEENNAAGAHDGENDRLSSSNCLDRTVGARTDSVEWSEFTEHLRCTRLKPHMA